MSEGPKKDGTSWDFKIDAQDTKAANAVPKASDRLKKQAQEHKEANPNLKIEKSKAMNISRTKLAAMEEHRGVKLGPVSRDVRVKAMGADLGVSIGLWIAAKSAVNPLALAIIAEAKAQNMAHIIENIPMFEVLVRVCAFLPLYALVMYLPSVFTCRTIGKMIFKCRVEDQDGGDPHRGTMIMRESVGKLITVISIAGIFMGLGKDGKFLHDKIFGTMVTKA